MNLKALNEINREEAVDAFLKCCTSKKWAGQMADRRPFSSADELYRLADSLWWNLNTEDWLEAFAGHPKIGDLDSLRQKYASTREWAGGEQSGVQEASEEVLQRLARGNQAYEEKFGYIFIVCATGKSAAEMLEILENRLVNDPADELKIAAEEQRKITQLRLEKLLS